MTLKQNIDQAAEMGRRAESGFVSQARINAENEVQRLQNLVNQPNAPLSTPTELANAQSRLAHEQQAEQAAATAAGQTARDTRAFSGSLNANESQQALEESFAFMLEPGRKEAGAHGELMKMVADFKVSFTTDV